nr:hypothetical protein [Hymenobacter volaticus]
MPIVAGYGYTSPELVGVGMALVGAGFAYVLLSRTRQIEPAAVPVPAS